MPVKGNRVVLKGIKIMQRELILRLKGENSEQFLKKFVMSGVEGVMKPVQSKGRV